jgi:hypothetical protein
MGDPTRAEARWSAQAKQLHTDWWQARIARQKEIDASIAAKADFECLYNKPYEDKNRVRVAGPFSVESLARLTGEEQKAAKITAFDLQTNPAQPGIQLHKLDKARDSNFLSVRVSRDIRLIVHRTAASLLLCYVDHHDQSYRWAERRKLETHPKTGAAQLVEIRETVQEILIPTYVEAAQPAPPKARLFEHVAEEALLSYGVPAEWLPDVRQANEDILLDPGRPPFACWQAPQTKAAWWAHGLGTSATPV